ncbi:MAG: hypothetical protein HYZ65_06775 [Burkholderiales bacterium]|nr:hypothetical protein [Burkholderiales bacterium]
MSWQSAASKFRQGAQIMLRFAGSGRQIDGGWASSGVMGPPLVACGLCFFSFHR